MRNKLIEFIEKYGMVIFAIWLLTVMSLQVFGQTRDSVYNELIKQHRFWNSSVNILWLENAGAKPNNY